MFKLVAVLFALVNGVPSEEPAGIFAHSDALFPNEDVCVAFLGTDAGKAAEESAKRLAAARGAYTARVACMRDKAAGEDSI